MRGPVVDSHVHVWDLSVGDYAWLTPAHGELYRSFGPDEAEAELVSAGVDAAVLVQAEDSVEDTLYLLGIAARYELLAGVVGWLPLEETRAAAGQLAEWTAVQSPLRGVRHLVHDDPRDDFLDLPAVRTSLRMVADHGLPLDVPDAWPRHLAGLARLADALPELIVVVDHLGKPPRGADDMGAWAAALATVAARPNVVAKVSGLQRPGQPFTADALRPVLHLALEQFGADRLMYGGDWPMTVPTGGYRHHAEVVWALVDELSGAEQDAVLHGTATRVYGLPSR